MWKVRFFCACNKLDEIGHFVREIRIDKLFPPTHKIDAQTHTSSQKPIFGGLLCL